jgi:hypothetical protein
MKQRPKINNQMLLPMQAIFMSSYLPKVMKRVKRTKADPG